MSESAVSVSSSPNAPRKIALLTWGSDGDINPFISLAGGLARRGHRVTLAIASVLRKNYRDVADALGFELIEIDGDDADLNQVAERLYLERNPLRQVGLVFDELMPPYMPGVFRVAESLCATHDVLIGHFILHPAHAAAQRAGIPYLTLSLNQSAIPTRYCPPLGAPPLGPWLNRLSWFLVLAILERIIGRRINAWRRQQGLPDLTSFRQAWESSHGNLIVVSPQFCPSHADWAAHQHICGFLPSPEASYAENIAPEIDAFLAAGAAPVYFSFGSMLNISQPRQRLVEAAQLMCAAAQASGCRAIVQAPWSHLDAMAHDPNLLLVERAPHRRVFPRCAAVVHHGGAGTTQTAALCGKPSVVVAHIADQYFWGRELERLGVAPALIERRSATPQKLARAIRHVIDTPAIGARADALGRRLQAEDGLTTTMARIETVLAQQAFRAGSFD